MVTAAQIQRFFDNEFPGSNIVVERVGPKQAQLRRAVNKADLRPGGSVSGPFMMALVDAALYAAIFAELGIVAHAVTTNLNINFLSKPEAEKDVIATCQLIKVGSKLIVGEVTLRSDTHTEPVAHAVGTYSIPPMR
ncbi:PaaI family thioesterase [Pseudoalteromonas sp. MM17-2]|nr:MULTISPECIES: PaaI family thioesterase [unclassified Pseudoalteromonas]MCG7546146.1 PaaI family thioesterase [Pseudoalteromonas sp. MM17-2]TLX49283.1 PaaI family thioesterase [Pseudoalteromonas ruthenica]TMO49905.1 PaaI family thioesterase [Pseudoalteromonas ruthenica]TMO50583.1 PaaI family thioesterase [Pseudoalteromonas ruthenica]